MRTSILVTCLLITLASCDCDDRSALPCREIIKDEIFEAKVHDVWCLPDESLKITFGPILEDSRCNIPGFDCFWAGRTLLELLIETNEVAAYKDTLYAELNWQDTLSVGNYSLELNKIFPLERTDFTVDTAKYRFQMVLR